MSQTKQLLQRISDQVCTLNIAGYLKEEVLSALKYLHLYKLQNIEKNLTCFCDYLLFLNHQNTEKILALATPPLSSWGQSSRDLNYFFSPSKKLTKKAQLTFVQKISYHSYELLTLMQGLKGILILTLDEFCNASEARISIHQMLMSQDSLYKDMCCTLKTPSRSSSKMSKKSVSKQQKKSVVTKPSASRVVV